MPITHQNSKPITIQELNLITIDGLVERSRFAANYKNLMDP